jgi:hypothetical protein
MNKALSITRFNLNQLKAAYIITAVLITAMASDYIISFAQSVDAEDITISMGNFAMLLPVLAAVFISLRNTRLTLNLGAKRQNVFAGTACVYVILAAVVPVVMLLSRYTVDAALRTRMPDGVIDLMDVFGFMERGPLVAFIQMFVLMLLIAVFFHTLISMQDKWFGWVADAVIIAILSIFIPIESLRKVLVRFFNLIIFNENAFLQIGSCLLLAIVIYAASRPLLNRKAI